jgi:hydrogenase-1 operon protein HyaF
MKGPMHTALASIPVRVENSTGNVLPILHEIRHALARLLADGTASIIDLKAVPLGPGEEDRILGALGEGEVRAELDSLGRSVVCESAYAGCWIVTHYDDADEVRARFIEIIRMPEILESQHSDIEDGLGRLTARLRAGE